MIAIEPLFRVEGAPRDAGVGLQLLPVGPNRIAVLGMKSVEEGRSDHKFTLSLMDTKERVSVSATDIDIFADVTWDTRAITYPMGDRNADGVEDIGVGGFVPEWLNHFLKLEIGIYSGADLTLLEIRSLDYAAWKNGVCIFPVRDVDRDACFGVGLLHIDGLTLLSGPEQECSWTRDLHWSREYFPGSLLAAPCVVEGPEGNRALVLCSVKGEVLMLDTASGELRASMVLPGFSAHGQARGMGGSVCSVGAADRSPDIAFGYVQGDGSGIAGNLVVMSGAHGGILSHTTATGSYLGACVAEVRAPEATLVAGAPSVAKLDGWSRRAPPPDGQVAVVRQGRIETWLTVAGAGPAFGTSICTSGDFDGDGIDDLLVGAPGSASDWRPGAVYALSGKHLAGRSQD